MNGAIVPPVLKRNSLVSSDALDSRRWWTLAVLCLSLLVIGLDNTILNVALPTLQTDLDASSSQLQWIVDIYMLLFAGVLLTAGSLGDRFGRKRALTLGLVVFGVGSLGSALAGSPGLLIAMRALMGIGGAFIMPSTLSILTATFPAHERGKAIGIWAGCSGIGIAIGPVAGGWLIEHANWSWIFLVNLPVVVLALAAGRFLVPESRDESAPRLDLAGFGLSFVALTALVWGLIEAPARGWTDGAVLTAFAVALFVGIAFVAWERRAPSPMLELALFRNRRFVTGSLVYGIAYLALAGVFFFMTLYFQNVRGWSALRTGLSWIPLNLPFLLVTPFAGRIVRALGSARTSGLGVLLGALGTATLAAIDVDVAYAQAVLGYVLLGLGFGLLVPAVSSAAMGAVPRAHSGVGSGVLNASRQLGAAVGLAVLGSISVAAVSRSWSDAGGPEALVQRVAGGEVPGAAAHDAFLAGLHAGLWTAAAALLVVSALAFVGLRATSAASAP
jgi:EmrB/QacA subfamily drug resistance transporter